MAGAAQNPERLRRMLITAAIVLLAIVAINVWYQPRGGLVRHAPPPTPETKTLPHGRPFQIAAGGYVGSKTCQSCHESKHETWSASYHRTMTQVVTPATAVGAFDGIERKLEGRFHNKKLQQEGLHCRLDQRGDEFWVSMDDLGEKDPHKTPQRIERQVVMSTGSHHMQVYWYASGKSRLLGQVPFVYLIDEQRWIPRRAAFLTDPHRPVTSEEGRWNGQCIACHSTAGIPKPTRDHSVRPPRITGADTRATEFGISCEACHGPGEKHVSLHRADKNLKEGKHIINPESLSPQLSSQVCGQCHSVHAYDSAQSRLDYIDKGPDFRPGQELEKSGVFIMKRSGQESHPSVANLLRADPHTMDGYFWKDGEVRVSGREYNGLLDSPCFQHSDETKTMSCLSCHSLHRERADTRPLREWANDQLKPSALDDRACTQCHENLSTEPELSAHTFHLPGSSGSRCYNCHMPHTTYGLLKAIRSHTISSPDIRTSIDVGRPNACNQCHLDKSLGWTADSLAQRYGHLRPKLSPVQEAVPASIQSILGGDAGQRALAAWTMGWPEARKTSGVNWMPEAMLPALNDPYEAVRLIAWRSLRQDPRLARTDYDFLASEADRIGAMKRLNALVRADSESQPGARSPAELLDDPDGKLGADVFNNIIRSRDNRPVSLVE